MTDDERVDGDLFLLAALLLAGGAVVVILVAVTLGVVAWRVF